jgi:LPS-assembly lipoprotein
MVRTRLRLGLAAAGVALAALTVGGCGFTPLYAVHGVTPGLSAIAVNVPHGRTAFLLSQDLEDSLARDKSIPPVYRLDITLEERNYPRGLQINDVATHNETHVNVGYHLIDLATGKVLKAGSERVEVTFAVAAQPYAGVSAEQDAEARAASTAADRIRLDLAVYFAQR